MRQHLIRLLLATFLLAALFSCNNEADKNKQKEVNAVNNAIQTNTVLTSNTATNIAQTDTTAILDTIAKVDSSIIHVDTITILGRHYKAIYYRNDNSYPSEEYFFVLNTANDTVFSDRELSPYFEFNDFDQDGHKDILFDYMSNTPSVQDLVLFDKQTQKFKKVADFSDYPAPEKIIGTKYYYSYHRSGCADMNWVSDLFYIENFKTVRVGNIAGIGCNDRDVDDGIYIHKVREEQEHLYKTLPIEIINDYEDYKWGFIKAYWEENYALF